MIDFQELLHRGQHLRRHTIRGRYAPSPTGSLHLGNLRTALLAWLQVRLQDGQLILRMEDLDLPRVKPGSADEILHDLRWLGLTWDEGPDIGGPTGPYNQSERDAIYEAVLHDFEARDLIFRCYCSRKDIQEASSAPHGPGGLIYPGSCRHLLPDARIDAQARHPNRPPSYRFRVHPGAVHFTDQIAGPHTEDLSQAVGDFVVRRADRLFAYQLAVVVDDALMGITDVLRGDDLLSSTARQIALFHALHVPPPRFWHAPLMLDSAGERLSKRDGSDSLATLRDQGLAAPDVIGLLAHSLGWIPSNTSISAQELLQEITLHDLGTLS